MFTNTNSMWNLGVHKPIPKKKRNLAKIPRLIQKYEPINCEQNGFHNAVQKRTTELKLRKSRGITYKQRTTARGLCRTQAHRHYPPPFPSCTAYRRCCCRCCLFCGTHAPSPHRCTRTSFASSGKP